METIWKNIETMSRDTQLLFGQNLLATKPHWKVVWKPFKRVVLLQLNCPWFGEGKRERDDKKKKTSKSLNPSTVFHTKIRIPVRINFPWQWHLAPWSAWHDIMLIDCAMKKRVQRYQEHQRLVFEVFELSSAKEGRVSLLVDVFPCASWSLVKVRTSAWRATWKTLVLGLTWREWAQESSIAAAAPQTVMDRRRQARGSDEESNYKEGDIDRQRKVLPVARALGRRRSWFHCACRVQLSYLRPSLFLLAISSTETLFAYAGEGGRGEWCGLLATWKSSRSWRMSSETHAERHEGRARGIAWRRARQGAQGSYSLLHSSTCQGRGRGLKKSNINCEEHQYLHYQMAWGKIPAWRASCWVLVIDPLTTANTTLAWRVNKILFYKSSEHILQAFSCCRNLASIHQKNVFISCHKILIFNTLLAIPLGCGCWFG